MIKVLVLSILAFCSCVRKPTVVALTEREVQLKLVAIWDAKPVAMGRKTNFSTKTNHVSNKIARISIELL